MRGSIVHCVACAAALGAHRPAGVALVPAEIRAAGLIEMAVGAGHVCLVISVLCNVNIAAVLVLAKRLCRRIIPDHVRQVWARNRRGTPTTTMPPIAPVAISNRRRHLSVRLSLSLKCDGRISTGWVGSAVPDDVVDVSCSATGGGRLAAFPCMRA